MQHIDLIIMTFPCNGNWIGSNQLKDFQVKTLGKTENTWVRSGKPLIQSPAPLLLKTLQANFLSRPWTTPKLRLFSASLLTALMGGSSIPSGWCFTFLLLKKLIGELRLFLTIVSTSLY